MGRSGENLADRTRRLCGQPTEPSAAAAPLRDLLHRGVPAERPVMIEQDVYLIPDRRRILPEVAGVEYPTRQNGVCAVLDRPQKTGADLRRFRNALERQSAVLAEFTQVERPGTTGSERL